MQRITFTVAIAALLISGAAQAQISSFLVRQYTQNGNTMCVYDNGTVLNMGYQLCPLSI